ncbi:hypothetical protein [Pseudomonas sp. FEN]|uniref:hypothetical protein n=1 Tax=Pseudomonas sp. FEN TaxID=2767468 RepID=UPI00174D193D|nr:hypothetical protein [Pseudomonas sp. FEN]CAD5200708.1 lipoprotein, putative [Pseudomonas sp. FEN]
MCPRILLAASLSLALSACVPYYDGGATYYRSEVYSAPAPAYYYGGGSYYRHDYYVPAPRYYAPPPIYRPYPNQGWNRPHWRGDDRGGHGGRRGDGGRGHDGRDR